MLRIFNSLTRTTEDFKPLQTNMVGVYSCGPTVYDFAHIGNFRTYVMADILVRALKMNGYDVKWIINITDVGHLVSDADEGEDKMEKGSRRTGKSAWEIADFYAGVFLDDWKKLGLSEPHARPRPTQHIKEQIALVQKLLDKGYAYKIDDGIYFDTSKYKDYGKLAHLDLEHLQEGARVEVNPQKRHPTDFALWKFSYPGGMSFEEYKKEVDSRLRENDKVDSGQARMTGEEDPESGLRRKVQDDNLPARRQMEWDSLWGVGFPGWHIECSAMSMKYLGEQFDIHTGATDLLPVHHTNELAQSEAATGKHPWVNYWIHGAFMLVQGQKMSKSLGNIYRVYDLEKQDYDPLAMRYLYLQTHYRQEMNFTFPSLEAAQNALQHLREELVRVSIAGHSGERSDARIFRGFLDKSQDDDTKKFEQKFEEAVNNDLNMPEALAVVWDMVKADIAVAAKAKLLLKFDEVLGLGLQAWLDEHRQLINTPLPREVKELVEVRNQLRKEKRFDQADQVRNQIKKLGYDIEDGTTGAIVHKIS